MPYRIKLFDFENKGEKKNYFLVILNGIFIRTSLAFVNTSTIIPAFLSHLTSSNIVIGIVLGVESIGWYLPQLFVASQIEHLPKKKWLYDVMTYFRVALLVVITVIVFSSVSIPVYITIVVFVISFILFSLAGGIAGIPFLHIISDTISQNKRGTIWSYRMVLGGVLSAIAALFVKNILDYFYFPHNYGVLFILFTIITFVGLIIFSFSYEPEGVERDKPRSIILYVMESGKLLRQDIDYRKMMVWRFFLSLWSMSIPFYTIFAIKKLGFSEMNIGFLFASQTAGLVLMSLIWGYISDRKSNRVVLIYNSIIAIIVPFLPLSAFYFKSHSTMLISITFFMMGSLLGGTWIGYLNYIIDLSPKEKVSTYVGFMNTFTGITFVLVPLGGLLADLFSLQTIFYISGVSGILMVVFSLLLRETRDSEGG